VFLVGLVLFVVIGVLLGVLGSGGSILAFPVFVYVLGISPADAVPMTMAIVGLASAGAALLKWRRRELHTRAFALFALTGIPGAWVGSRYTEYAPALALTLLFAVILVAAGIVMWRGRMQPPPGQPCQIARCLMIGAVIGLLTGFLGVGGGFLLVPALTFFAGIGWRRAVGTSVAIIAVNSAAGLAGHVLWTDMDWQLAASSLAALLPGVFLGSLGAANVPTRALERGLAAVMIALGIVMAGGTLVVGV
jgi:uncharacterized membrane protein YfcA